jgi:hypothetical protein
MRNQWYGDRRDVIKWGVLLHLAHTYQLKCVLQVAYFGLDDVPTIEFEDGEVEVTPAVLEHFRDIHRIKELSKSTGVQIELVGHEFRANSRNKYTMDVVKHIQALDGKASAVLLDPDTGILNNPKSQKHVTPMEVSAIWNALCPKDWLVLYQHASRDRNWREERCKIFKAACDGARVLLFHSPKGAHDVAFFATSRSLVGETSGSS